MLLQLPPHVVGQVHGIILAPGSLQRLVPAVQTAITQCSYSLLPCCDSSAGS